MRIWHDLIPMEQYDDRGIDVPYKINKTRVFRVVPGIDEEQTRGSGMNPKEIHIEVYKKQSDNAIELIHNLFK